MENILEVFLQEKKRRITEGNEDDDVCKVRGKRTYFRGADGFLNAENGGIGLNTVFRNGRANMTLEKEEGHIIGSFIEQGRKGIRLTFT